MKSNSFPPRIQAFRDHMIKLLPRAPNTRASLEALQAMPTQRLILAFLTWRTRLIPAKPRTVRLWQRGVTPFQFQLAKPKLLPLLERVAAGEDLTPFLSDLVNRKGVILPSASRSDKRQDIDRVLTRHGLHHFHVGVAGPGNPKNRSGTLVFAEVLEKEFRIVSISNHNAFQQASVERQRFFRICEAYVAKNIPTNEAYMTNPVMSSGHSVLLTLFGMKCADEMRRLDPLLDDPAFIDKLYNEQPISRGEHPRPRSVNPSLSWHFEDLKFGILDRTTMVFFCMFQFLAR